MGSRKGSPRSYGTRRQSWLKSEFIMGEHQKKGRWSRRNNEDAVKKRMTAHEMREARTWYRPPQTQTSLWSNAKGYNVQKIVNRSVSTDERVNINSCRKAGIDTQRSASAWQTNGGGLNNRSETTEARSTSVCRSKEARDRKYSR
jgi:hypothetical protein